MIILNVMAHIQRIHATQSIHRSRIDFFPEKVIGLYAQCGKHFVLDTNAQCGKHFVLPLTLSPQSSKPRGGTFWSLPRCMLYCGSA